MKIEFADLQFGDKVTIAYPLRGRDTVAQTGTGKVVMRGTYGWVLNMGGRYGRPEVATEKNFVTACRSKKG